MNPALIIGTVVAIYLPVIITPGPNFLAVSQAAMSQSRAHGVYTGLGVSTGSTLLACLAATGLGIIIHHLGWLYHVLQVVGGGYLLYIGQKLWRHAGQPMVIKPMQTCYHNMGKAYWHGLATNLTNPKALLFFSSIFAALLSTDTPLWLRLVAIGIISLISTVWHVLLATVFSHAGVQQRYMRAKKTLDRVSGSFLAVIGLDIMLSSRG